MTTATAGISETEKQRIERDFRVPVDGLFPGTVWIVNLDSESILPSDLELQQLRSLIEFKVRRFFNDTWVKKLLAMPLAKDGGHNTLTLRKGDQWGRHDGWFFRRASWNRGPTVIPSITMGEDGVPPRWTLVETIDFAGKIVDTPDAHWEAWKSEHPDLFSHTS